MFPGLFGHPETITHKPFISGQNVRRPAFTGFLPVPGIPPETYPKARLSKAGLFSGCIRWRHVHLFQRSVQRPQF
jgi:hypothetical protein